MISGAEYLLNFAQDEAIQKYEETASTIDAISNSLDGVYYEADDTASSLFASDGFANALLGQRIDTTPSIEGLFTLFANFDELTGFTDPDGAFNFIQRFIDFPSTWVTGDDNDIIIGAGAGNIQFGGHGDDIMLALGRLIRQYGGEGDDYIVALGEDINSSGNDGDDTMILFGKEMVAFGGDGNDFAMVLGDQARIRMDGGNDVAILIGNMMRVWGGDGDDVLVVVGDESIVIAGGGNDFVVNIAQETTIYGGMGNDIFINLAYTNVCYSGSGADLILGNSGDTIYAGEGADYIQTAADAEGVRIFGNEGGDVLILSGLNNEYVGDTNYRWDLYDQDSDTPYQFVDASNSDADLLIDKDGPDRFVLDEGAVNALILDANEQDFVVADNMSTIASGSSELTQAERLAMLLPIRFGESASLARSLTINRLWSDGSGTADGTQHLSSDTSETNASATVAGFYSWPLSDYSASPQIVLGRSLTTTADGTAFTDAGDVIDYYNASKAAYEADSTNNSPVFGGYANYYSVTASQLKAAEVARNDSADSQFRDINVAFWETTGGMSAGSWDGLTDAEQQFYDTVRYLAEDDTALIASEEWINFAINDGLDLVLTESDDTIAGTVNGDKFEKTLQERSGVSGESWIDTAGGDDVLRLADTGTDLSSAWFGLLMGGSGDDTLDFSHMSRGVDFSLTADGAADKTFYELAQLDDDTGVSFDVQLETVDGVAVYALANISNSGTNERNLVDWLNQMLTSGVDGGDSEIGAVMASLAQSFYETADVTSSLSHITIDGVDYYADGFENIRGTMYDDVLRGNADSNRMEGLGGADEYIFKAGDDLYAFIDEIDDGAINTIVVSNFIYGATSAAGTITADELFDSIDIDEADGVFTINFLTTIDSQGTRSTDGALIEINEDDLDLFVFDLQGQVDTSGTVIASEAVRDATDSSTLSLDLHNFTLADLLDFEDGTGQGKRTVSSGTLVGSIFADILIGSDDDDTYYDSYGGDAVDMGAGNDVVFGMKGTGNLFIGGVDADNDGIIDDADETDTFDADTDEPVTIDLGIGGGSDNVWIGTASEHSGRIELFRRIVLGGGSDTFTGSADDETVVGNAGDDTLRGGAGIDTLDYSLEAGDNGIDLDLGAGTVVDTYGDTDTVDGFEIFVGTTADDRFIGDGNDNEFRLLAGSDVATGQAGDDVFIGGLDFDDPEVETFDIVDYGSETGTSGVMVDLAEGYAIDTFGDTDLLLNIFSVATTAKTDQVFGSQLDDVIIGSTGNDMIDGGGADLGGDTVYYGALADGLGVTVDLGASIVWTSFVDLSGQQWFSSRDDIIVGTAGADTIHAGDGDNVVFGEEGDDVIEGGTGNDLVIGGAGSDTYILSDGDDTYVIDDLATAGTDQFVVDGEVGDASHRIEIADSGHDYSGLYFTLDGDRLSVHNADNLGTTAPTEIAAFDLTSDNSATFTVVVADESGGAIALSGGDLLDLAGTYFDAGSLGSDPDSGTISAIWTTILTDKGASYLTSRASTFTSVPAAPTVPTEDAAGNIQATVDYLWNAEISDGSHQFLSQIQNVTGSSGDDDIRGDGGVNVLLGGAGNDRLDGGGGDDYLAGGEGDDLYIIEDFGLQDRRVTIDNSGESASSDAIVLSEAGLSFSDLYFTRLDTSIVNDDGETETDADLQISTLDDAGIPFDSVTVDHWFAEEVDAASGLTEQVNTVAQLRLVVDNTTTHAEETYSLDAGQINELTTAMASFVSANGSFSAAFWEEKNTADVAYKDFWAVS